MTESKQTTPSPAADRAYVEYLTAAFPPGPKHYAAAEALLPAQDAGTLTPDLVAQILGAEI